MAETKQHHKKRKRGIFKTGFIILLFFIALLLITYPYISNFVFEHRAESLVVATDAAADTLDAQTIEQMLQDAAAYNQSLLSGHVQLTDPFDASVQGTVNDAYNDLLDIGDGIMGTIQIPSINVSLPIYHGTSEAVLEKGVGHLCGTSLPVGGEGTHAVLTGHTGLSNARLFSDLSLLEEGDVFYINILGETLTYQVDQIKVVLPTQMEDLSIQPDADYCTLVTCTPYGINSHRLLVRGVRIENPDMVQADSQSSISHGTSQWMTEYRTALIISLLIFTAGVIALVLVRLFKRRRRDAKAKKINDKKSGP